MAGCDVLYFDSTHRDQAGNPLGSAGDGWRPCTAPGQVWTDPDLILRMVCTRHRRQLTALHAAGLADQVRWQRPGHRPNASQGGDAMSRAQHILAVIVGLITGVLLMESYGAMVTAARAGGRAIPELWPLGTEALALAMEVSVLEAKRLGHRAVLRLSWLLLVASVALSTLLQVAVAPPTLVGYLTAGATPVWLLGSFAVLSLLYRAEVSATQAPATAEVSAAAPLPGAEVLTKRAQAERIYADLSADGAPISAGQLAAAAGLSASYARALIAQFQSRLPAAVEQNGRRPAPADADPEAGS